LGGLSLFFCDESLPRLRLAGMNLNRQGLRCGQQLNEEGKINPFFRKPRAELGLSAAVDNSRVPAGMATKPLLCLEGT
jgi:hypothetical protein